MKVIFHSIYHTGIVVALGLVNEMHSRSGPSMCVSCRENLSICKSCIYDFIRHMKFCQFGLSLNFKLTYFQSFPLVGRHVNTELNRNFANF